MANVPYPITGPDLPEMRMQIQELLRQLYEEKIGGADLGDVFSLPGDVLTLVLADDSGLTKDGNELAVDPSPTGGLNIVSTGLAVKLADATLTLSASGLAVTAATTGAAVTVTDETTYSLSTNVGAGTRFARNDHTHGSPPYPIDVDGIYINTTGADPATELLYGTWVEETSIGATFYELTIGDGTDNVDPFLTFDGFDADGILKWMEDEDYFRFEDGVLVPSTEQIYFSDTSSYIQDDATNLKIVTNDDIKVTCGANKTIELQNVVYQDANMGALILRTGGTAPGVVQWVDNDGDNTGIYTVGFAINEEGSGSIEMPHDYKEGTNIVFHIHWGANDAPTGTDYVKWQLTYNVQRDETTFVDSTTISVETPYDTQYETLRSDFTAINGASFKIGDQFNFTVKRIAADGDAFGGEALVETLGFHYQVDTLGSRQIGTK